MNLSQKNFRGCRGISRASSDQTDHVWSPELVFFVPISPWQWVANSVHKNSDSPDILDW